MYDNILKSAVGKTLKSTFGMERVIAFVVKAFTAAVLYYSLVNSTLKTCIGNGRISSVCVYRQIAKLSHV